MKVQVGSYNPDGLLVLVIKAKTIAFTALFVFGLRLSGRFMITH